MYTHTKSKRQCFRSIKHKKIAGVCAGLASRFDMPRWLTRLAAILVFFKFPMFMLIAYVAAYIVLPEASGLE